MEPMAAADLLEGAWMRVGPNVLADLTMLQNTVRIQDFAACRPPHVQAIVSGFLQVVDGLQMVDCVAKAAIPRLGEGVHAPATVLVGAPSPCKSILSRIVF